MRLIESGSDHGCGRIGACWNIWDRAACVCAGQQGMTMGVRRHDMAYTPLNIITIIRK